MNPLEKFILNITEWVGTPASIIAHTVFFIGIFCLSLFGVELDSILLILTTAVSLEAIYLAIFIQISVNRSNATIEDIEKDVDEIQANVDEIQEDVEDIQEDMDELQEDVEDIGESVLEDEQTDHKPESNQDSIFNPGEMVKIKEEISEIKLLLRKLEATLNQKDTD